MSVSNEDAAGYTYSSDMVAGIRFRAGMIVLLGTSSVALAFGLSFYFALVSSHTAVARQYPDLAPVVDRLKDLLVINTFGFVAIVIASFWILTRLVTGRMFSGLGAVMSDMRRASENKLPHPQESRAEGPFGDFSRQWEILLSTLRENEEREIAILRKSLESPAAPGGQAVAEVLREMLEMKERRLNAAVRPHPQKEAAAGEDSGDPLFMQPV